MSSMVVNEDYDESIREGETNFDPFGSFADTLIDEMMVDEIAGKFDAEVNYLASTEDAKLMRKALGEINLGIDSDSEVSDLLDRLDSKLIYHHNPKDYTTRETVCAYLNTVCEWSVLLANSGEYETDEFFYGVPDLFKEYQDFVKNELIGVARRKQMKLADFKSYLKKHVVVKNRDEMYKGERMRSDTIIGLPQLKNW